MDAATNDRSQFSIHDLRWAKLKGFSLGFCAGCATVVGLVKFLLTLKGL